MSEEYGHGWCKVILMVNVETGELHAVSGDIESKNHEGDEGVSVGLKWIKHHWMRKKGAAPPAPTTGWVEVELDQSVDVKCANQHHIELKRGMVIMVKHEDNPPDQVVPTTVFREKACSCGKV